MTEDVEQWLTEKRSTLFGQFFEIKTEAGRREAAEWLVAQLDSFHDWCEQ